MANGRQGRRYDRLADDGGQRYGADELQLAVGEEANAGFVFRRRRCFGDLGFSWLAVSP